MKKRIIALVLIAAMCFALCACGDKKTEEDTAQKPDSSTSDEFVYTASFQKISEDSTIYVNPRLSTPEGYYITTWEKTGENIPEGVTPEYEGQYDVYSFVVYLLDKSGRMTKLDGFKPIEAEENTDGKKEFSSSSDMGAFAIDSEGKFITIETVYTSWFEGDDNYERYSDDYWMSMKYKQTYYIRRLEADGTELSRAEIPTDEETYLNTYYMQLDSNDNVVFTVNNCIVAVSADGSEAYRITLDDFVDGVVKLGDGRLGVIVYGGEGQTLYIIDEENKCCSESYSVNFDAYSCISGADGYDLCFTSGSTFYGLKLADGEPEKIFNWINCDVNSSAIGSIFLEDDGSIVTFSNEWNSADRTYSCERIVVSKQPADSVPKKETIRLAVMYSDYTIMNAIVKFNRSSDRYRIELDDYSQYNNDEDGWDAGQTKLLTEIMAGNVPDLFSLNGLNYNQLAGKGLLEDLYPYIDADPELDRDDFFPNVLKALEVDGKLCSTVSCFSISTVVGASSVVGDTPGWTYEELEQALETMPEGCTVFDQCVTKNDILYTCLTLDMDDFVNWSTGECSFDSEQFIALLNFVNSFPSEFDWESFNGESSLNRISQGKQMLSEMSVYSIDDVVYSNLRAFGGGDVTYIGYPTYNGVGNMLRLSNNGIGMSAKCANKDAAWQFMRCFFTEEHQETNSWSFPSNRKLFEEKLSYASTIEYQQDANGNYVLDSDGEKIPIAKYSVWNEEENRRVDVYCMSEEQANQIRELVTSTEKLADSNSEIINIVSEQVQAFFEGQRSAEDVAKLIQSKVNIYVNEQR